MADRAAVERVEDGALPGRLVQGMKKYESLAKVLMGANLAMVCLTVLGLFEFNSVIVPIVGWVVYGVVIIVWSLAITRKRLLVAHPARTGRAEETSGGTA